VSFLVTGVAALRAEACVGCAICVMDCPDDAVRVPGPKVKRAA
jgi:NAD-dependent dihydropyrimidine dehydrogenase PreA subunit